MKGILWHISPTTFSSCPSSLLSWDLSLAKTHGAWLQHLMKFRLLMSHCKNLVRDTANDKRWICSDLERSILQECRPSQRGGATEFTLWLVFQGWVISYANEQEDHPNYWGTTHSCLLTVPWNYLGTSGCHLAYRLRIKV